MHNNYLIVYNNVYSLNEEINKLTTKDFSAAEKNIYDLDEVSLENALIDLDTYSFLTNKKIIIIKNIDTLQEGKEESHLIKYLNNPSEDNLLIMTTKKFNANKKINKELKKLVNFISLEEDPNKVVKDILKDYKIDNKLINKIIEYSNNNVDIIKNECDKLILYKENNKEITEEDIQKVVVKHLGESNDIVFELIKYISSKDKKRALNKYLLLEEYNIDDISLIGLLESQLRLMMEINILMDERKNKNQIATELNTHPYRIQKTMELLTSVSKKEIIKLIKDLSDIDYKIKAGIINSKESVLLYIINM